MLGKKFTFWRLPCVAPHDKFRGLEKKVVEAETDSAKEILPPPDSQVRYTAGLTSKYDSKIRGALKGLEWQAELVHEKKSGAHCGKQLVLIQVFIC